MAFSVSDVRINGCLFGAPSQRDFRTAFRDDSVPDRVDLRPYCTPVENQGQIGSCTANATVGALEYHYKRRDGQAPDLSRMFVYYNARRTRGQVMIDTGAQIRESMASIIAFGACREDVWPYNPAMFAAEPPQDAYTEALKHQAIQYARVNGGEGAIQALARELPVVFGTVIPQRCFMEAGITGVIPEPTWEERSAPVQGGHAMLIVGYDRNERMFIVRNSWGEEWGDRGYCRIPFDVMDACSRAEDFWVVAELEKAPSVQLIRPGLTAAAQPPRPAAPSGRVAGSAAALRDQIRSGLAADIAASSRKIDGLLSGPTRATGAPAEPAGRTSGFAAVLPCTACAGSGSCAFCQGKNPGCTGCRGTGICAECGGTGVI